MRKRLSLTASIAFVLLLLNACAAPVKAQPQDISAFLVKEGTALTCEMDKLAETKEYVALMGASGNLSEIIDKAAAGDYTAPQNAYVVKLTEDSLLKAIHAVGGLDIPQSVRDILKYKMNAVLFANLVNATYGSEMVAATSVLMWGKSYIQPEGWVDNTLLLLEYPGEFSSMVSFVQSGEGVISASSVFVKNDEEGIASMLQNYLGDTGIPFTQYDAGKLQVLLGK